MGYYRGFVRKLFVFILLAGLTAGTLLSSLPSVQAAPQLLVSTNIVISQIYGGGGNSGATLKNDFIELHNLGSSPVEVTGWSVQYASAAGSSWTQTPLSGTMQPGQYYLIQEAAGSGGTVDLPTPDAAGSISIAATAGKVALVNGSIPLSGACPSGVVDFVGYGSSANCYEGSNHAPAPSNTTVDLRINNGCTDTDDNSSNFAASAPVPRNSSHPIVLCMNPLTVTSAANLTGTASALTATAASVNLTGTAAGLTATASAFTPTPTTTNTGTATNTPTASLTPTRTSTAGSTPVVCSTAYSHHSLFINEIGWMGTAASSSDEWIELVNPGSSCVDLSGWTLRIVDSNINIHLSGAIGTGTAAYFVLANDAGVFKNSDGSAFAFGQVTASLSLLNSGAALYLIGPDGYTQVDTANWWDGSWPAGIASSTNSNLAYSAMERYRLPDGTIPDDNPSAWVTFVGPAANSPLDHDGNHVHGTPGMANWAWTVTETPSPFPTGTHKPTPTFAPTPAPAVVINEILARPGSDWNGDGAVDDSDEFIEVENLGPGIATLSNWRFSIMPSRGTSSFSLPTLKLNPNQRAVFFRSITHLLLADSGDTVSLTDTHGVIEDAFTYPAVLQADAAWCRIRDGIGFWQNSCFPTPGLKNALSGILPPPPLPQPGQQAVCLLPDVAPGEFRLAECGGPGADIWNQQYWNDQAGQNKYLVPDPNSKSETFIQ